MISSGATSSAQPHIDNAVDASTPISYDAAHAVLSTNELLCDIISRLSFKDVIAIIGVCKAWRKALTEDPTVSKALFLRPEPISIVMAAYHLAWNLHKPIPLERCMVLGKLHPCLSETLGRIWTWYHEHSDYGDEDRIEDSEFQAIMPPCLMPETSKPKGIWRDMFLTQPPCQLVTAWITDRGPSNTSLDLKFERKGGIKMGELYEFLQPHLPERRDDGTSVITIHRFQDNDGYWMPSGGCCEVRDGEVCRPEPRGDRPDDSQAVY